MFVDCDGEIQEIVEDETAASFYVGSIVERRSYKQDQKGASILFKIPL